MIFDVIVVTSFILQVYNLYELGRGKIHYLLMIMICLLFAAAEAWVAIADERHSYWMYVSLSIFGALQGVRGYVREKGNIYIK